jgi:hypothetical protein
MIDYAKIAGTIYENINTADENKVYLEDGTEIIVADDAQLTKAFNNEQARINRAAEYPDIGDQLDALFHAGLFPSDMASALQAVKDKYPKID